MSRTSWRIAFDSALRAGLTLLPNRTPCLTIAKGFLVRVLRSGRALPLFVKPLLLRGVFLTFLAWPCKSSRAPYHAAL